jgi:hypothetical protein
MAKCSPENRQEQVAPRLVNGRFAPGASPNPGGRPAALAEVRELARQHTTMAIDTLVKIADRGKTEMAKIAASNALLDRGWGKPTQPISGDDDMPPVAMTVEDREAEIAERKHKAVAAINAAFAEYVPTGDHDAA